MHELSSCAELSDLAMYLIACVRVCVRAGAKKRERERRERSVHKKIIQWTMQAAATVEPVEQETEREIESVCACAHVNARHRSKAQAHKPLWAVAKAKQIKK